MPAPSAGDSAVSMTNAITVARFVGGVMEIECEFSTVSGSCNNGVQWSMWDSVTRSSSFSDQEIIIYKKKKRRGRGRMILTTVMTKTQCSQTHTHARTHTRTHILQATISLSPSISHQCCMCAVLRLTASKIEAPEDKTITTLCIRGLKPEYGITEQDVRCALLLLAAAQRCLVQLFGMAVWCARVLSHAWDVCCWALL